MYFFSLQFCQLLWSALFEFFSHPCPSLLSGNVEYVFPTFPPFTTSQTLYKVRDYREKGECSWSWRIYYVIHDLMKLHQMYSVLNPNTETHKSCDSGIGVGIVLYCCCCWKQNPLIKVCIL